MLAKRRAIPSKPLSRKAPCPSLVLHCFWSLVVQRSLQQSGNLDMCNAAAARAPAGEVSCFLSLLPSHLHVDGFQETDASNLPYYSAIIAMCGAVKAHAVLKRVSAAELQATVEVTSCLSSGQRAVCVCVCVCMCVHVCVVLLTCFGALSKN